MQFFETGVQFQRARGKIRELRIARWCVGRALRSLGRVQEALSIQKELDEEWTNSTEEQDGYVAEEVAECLLALGQVDESRPYLAQAYTLLSQDTWLTAEATERLQRL